MSGTHQIYGMEALPPSASTPKQICEPHHQRNEAPKRQTVKIYGDKDEEMINKPQSPNENQMSGKLTLRLTDVSKEANGGAN